MFIPKARPHTLKFFTLSYYNPASGGYDIGGGDYYFIAFCIVLFTGLRAVLMEHVLAPLAKHWGLKKRKDMTRFSEQAWLLIYYSFFWPFGVVCLRSASSLSSHDHIGLHHIWKWSLTAEQYLYYNSPSYMNMSELWTDWPTREVTGLVKAYFLGQWAFWLQQVLVIHIEERRKDHWQMLTHHFVTIALMTASYCYHLTRVGILILVLMDIVDIFLPVSPRNLTSPQPPTNQLIARKVSQVSRLLNVMRRHVRHVHGFLVLGPTRFVSHGVLEHLDRFLANSPRRLFLRQ
jgi:acyl-CoA-dependent ceramide synthase